MKKAILCLSLFVGTFLITSNDVSAQGGKKHDSYVLVANPPNQIKNAIENLKPDLVIEAGFEKDMIIECHYSKGSYFVQLYWVARFIEDDWGGFAFPGAATMELTGGGKVKYSNIYYELGY